MNKYYKVALPASILIIGCFLAYFLYVNIQGSPNQEIPSRNQPMETTAVDPLNATYTIENVSVSLVNGKAESTIDGSKVTTSIVGQPVVGDINADDKDDSAVFITQNSGGTGVFYYVALAINTANGTKGTNAVFLGDRILTKNIQIKSNQLVVNFTDRKSSDPMVAPPTVNTSILLTFDGTTLKKSTESSQKITYITSNEDPTKFCNGEDMDSAGYQKTITSKNSTTIAEKNPTNIQIIKATIDSATSGMCRTVLNKLDITEIRGIVTIPPIDGWAGFSIEMCSCKPLVETNVLQIPGMKKVIWQ
ncbi:MAG: hypothetical protein NUV81_00010 [bacterium]|nr:hypothetical protein [bacterium]